jgi:ribonuclease P protein component
MLASKYRLKQRADISRVFKHGKSVHGRWFNTRYRPNHQSHCRATVIISGKIIKGAVARNRLRRRLRGLLEDSWPALRTTADIAVVVLADFSQLSPQELASELTSQLRRARLIS